MHASACRRAAFAAALLAASPVVAVPVAAVPVVAVPVAAVLAIGLPVAARAAEGPAGDGGAATAAAGALTPGGRMAALAARLEPGGPGLPVDRRHGLLPGLLAALDIPLSSQTLVFSKTSFQAHQIDPVHPRAVYFNDDTYVGWVPGSDVIEIASADGESGAEFFTLESGGDGQPRLIRDVDRCGVCHVSQHTAGVPGFVVRSVVATPAGRFVAGATSFVTDDSSPLERRWGGWYVTGAHGAMRHMGNATYPGHSFVEPFDLEAGANLMRLPAPVAAENYPVASSDIVALLVLEHQLRTHNALARAAVDAAAAARLDAEPAPAGGAPDDAARRRFERSGDEVVRCLLMADAISFASPVRGTSGFAAEFAARGPHDARGRSLRQLDLDRRLFAYRLSHLVHGGQFARLPVAVKRHVGGRLHAIFCAEREVVGFGHIGRDEREAIAAILAATEPDFWWTFVVPPPIGPPPAG